MAIHSIQSVRFDDEDRVVPIEQVKFDEPVVEEGVLDTVVNYGVGYVHTVRAVAETAVGAVTGMVAFPISKGTKWIEYALSGGNLERAKAAEEKAASRIQFVPETEEARHALDIASEYVLDPAFKAFREVGQTLTSGMPFGKEPAVREFIGDVSEVGGPILLGSAFKAGKAKVGEFLKKGTEERIKPIEEVKFDAPQTESRIKTIDEVTFDNLPENRTWAEPVKAKAETETAWETPKVEEVKEKIVEPEPNKTVEEIKEPEVKAPNGYREANPETTPKPVGGKEADHLIKDGWLVTGLTNKGEVSPDRVMWASKEIDQAEYFAGHGSGQVVYSKPKKNAKILDLTDEKQKNDFLQEVESLRDNDSYGLRSVVEDAEQYQTLKELLHPEDIVEEGGLWDNTTFKNAIWEEYNYDFIKTHDGGIFLNPGAAEIKKATEWQNKKPESKPRYDEFKASEAKPEEVKPTIKEPPPQEPVKPIEQPEGATNESRLAQRAETDAIENKLTEDFGDLVDYKTMSMKDQAERAQQLLDADYEKAKRMAMGQEYPPEGLREASVYEAVKIRALREGDVETLRRLATESTVPRRLSEYGQAIKAADSRIMDDPVKVMQDVAETRAEKSAKKYGKTDPELVKQVAKLSEELEKTKQALDEQMAKAETKGTVDGVDELIKTEAKPKVEKKVYGSDNQIVNIDRYNQAKAELRKMLGGTQLNVGIDPTIAAKVTEIGVFHLEAGVRQFKNWSNRMVADVGAWVKPHLKDIWENAKGTVHKATLETTTKKIKESVERGNELPEIGLLVQKLAKHFVAQGVKDRVKLVTEVHNVLKDIILDITPRETADAISGYGKYKQLSKDDVSLTLRDIKGQLQQVSKLEDLESRKPPLKTGVERRIPSDEERRLIKQVEEAKKKYGIQTTDKETQLKSSLDAIKTRLTNQIADLTKEISTKQKIVKEKHEVPLDQEANALKVKRDALKKERDEIFAKPKQTASEKYEQARKKALERQIELLEKQITAKEKVTKQKMQLSMDKKTADLVSKRDRLQKAYADLFGPTEATKEQRIKAATTALVHSIAEYTRRINAKDISPLNKKRDPLHTKELDQLRAERDLLKEQFQTLRDIANPKKTPEQIALQSLKTRLKNEAKKFGEKLDNLNFTKPQRKSVVLDAEGLKIKAEHERLKTAYQTLAEKVGTVTKEEAVLLVTLSKEVARTRSVMEQGGNRFYYGAAKVTYENYVKQLKGENAPIKQMLQDRWQEAKTTWKENKAQAIWDGLKDTIQTLTDNSIAMVATLDNSFLGRQGLKTLMTHPSAWWPGAVRSFTDFGKTLKGKNAHDLLMIDIYSRPEYLNGEYQRAKILPKSEEQYPQNLPERIPGLGRVFKASEYAFTGSGIRMRTDLYDLLSKRAKENGVDMASKQNVEGLGKLINSLTARGQWGERGEPAIIRIIMWAPKMLKANIDVLTMHNFGSGLPNPYLRKQAAMNLFKIVAETATVMTIANALVPGSAEYDPRSADFGKIKVNNTRYDITGGAASIVTLAARIATQSTKNARGEVKDYGIGYGKSNSFDALINFLVGKTSPPTRFVVDWMKGKNWKGEKYTMGGAAYQAVTPIAVQNVIDLKDDASAEVVAGVILDGLGISSNTYENKKK